RPDACGATDGLSCPTAKNLRHRLILSRVAIDVFGKAFAQRAGCNRRIGMVPSAMTVSPRETMIQMRKFGWRGMVCTSVAFMAALCIATACLAANGSEPRFFRIGTAATGGSFFEIGGVVAGAISSPQGGPPCGHGGSCGVLGLVAVAQATP